MHAFLQKFRLYKVGKPKIESVLLSLSPTNQLNSYVFTVKGLT